jgi:2-aminoethylphosphonate-pyruvate transaminase
MTNDDAVSPARDKLLFTPGPLTTSPAVKQAMLRDVGSRDAEFLAVVRDIRRRLLLVAGVHEDYTAVLMQGSGTFAIEAVIGSVIPPDGRLLVLVNGAYGRRIAQIAATLRINHVALACPEHQQPELAVVEAALVAGEQFTHLAVVHCETTSGIINPVAAIGALAHKHGAGVIVDAMSSFAAVPLDLQAARVDYLVSSANKCIEGVPGFAFVLARVAALAATEGWARSLSLDLLAQWQELERSGQFRFTPPTHALLAFQRALRELEAEGGVAARGARYRRNHAMLVEGMRALGFHQHLAPHDQSPIITSFRYPEHAAFEFSRFYELLNERGFVIYPGKLSDAACFRIGTIGRLFPHDVRALLAAMREVLAEMGVTP